LDLKVPKDSKETKETKEQDHKVLKEIRVLEDPKVFRVHRELKDSRVS
jgi:hypothetical protein